MTDDQQLFWDIISRNYANISHRWGKELLELSKQKKMNQFHSRASECVLATLDWPIDARSRAVKTWLNTYKLPLVPGRMKSFYQFHVMTGSYIFAKSNQIKAYD